MSRKVLNEQLDWAILVIWKDGEEEYLHEGLGTTTARFRSRNDAIEQTKFMKMGMDDEVQSINVVPYPRGEPK